MREIVKSTLGLVVLAGLVAAIHLSCNPVPMTARPGSTITAFANPGHIPAHGGTSRISAIVVSPTGAMAPDGTVVQFFTDLGRIEQQAKTNDGVASAFLVSDGRSGTANVLVFSGGTPASGPDPDPDPDPTPTPSPDPDATVNVAAAISTSVPVVIGNANTIEVILTVSPSRVSRNRSALVVATVTDDNGNPIPDVAVFFSVEPVGDGAFNERLSSRGSPVFTDNNGRAEDVLTTTKDPLVASYSVLVKAEVAGVATDEEQTVLVD
jgi:hypothetical protein